MRTELSHLTEISLEVAEIEAGWDGFFSNKHPIQVRYIYCIVLY